MAPVPKLLSESQSGKATLRLLSKEGAFVGIVILAGTVRANITGTDRDDVVRRLHDAAAQLHPHFHGFAGARNRFLHFFPNGFGSEAFLATERNYKLNAKKRLDEVAPLAEAKTAKGLGKAVLSVFQRTNLLSPFEKAKLREVLLEPSGDLFVNAAAVFAGADREAGLARMEEALKPQGVASWPAVSYLPFLWCPTEHMFLKPTKTVEYAQRVGHPFAGLYEPRLKPPVYEGLLDLVSRTEAEIGDMGPRDRIDVQSFIWVVSDYVEDGQSRWKLVVTNNDKREETKWHASHSSPAAPAASGPRSRKG